MENVCAKLVRYDVDEEAKSELTNDPNINAVVDIIADGVSVLGNIIKSAITGEDGNMTLGEEMTEQRRMSAVDNEMIQQRQFQKVMSVSNLKEAGMEGADEISANGRVSPGPDHPGAPKVQKESFWRGSRLSDIPNSCGLFVAEAMRVRSCVEEAKKALSDVTEVDVNVVGFKPIRLTRADIGRMYMDEVAQIQDACTSIYNTWSRSQAVPKSKKEQKKHFDLVNGSLIATEYSDYDIVEILANNIEFTDSWKQDDVTSGKGFWKGSVYGGPKKTLNFYTTDEKQTFLDIYINEDGLPFSTGTVDVLKVPALHEGSDVNVTCSIDDNGIIGTEAMFVDLR